MGNRTALSVAAVCVIAAAMIVSAQQAAPPVQGSQTPSSALRTLTPEEVTALSQGMPEGPDRELVVRVCSKCHEPQRVAALRLTRDGWEAVVAKMATLGARMTDQEFTRVVGYLAENYKGEAPKPINLNTATSVELESVGALLRKEAAAWMAYRTKHPCKTLDDLKSVPGVPFKKIDERRDRLVCF